tara:strand:- start:18501 stop:19094 length:594 start_codon:yes stop_codon:yes gene_type:complete
MSKDIKEVTKSDLISLDQYSVNRKNLRKNLIEFKKHRRVQLGPYATFYFECYETMLAQIQEMLFIEKGGDSQINDELSAYNPLIPKGKELIATLMFEIDNPLSRAEFLNKIGGIENKVFLKINDEKIKCVPEHDVDRTSAEGKASSVQFVHFNFTEQQIVKFKDFSNSVTIGIDHEFYNHYSKMSEDTRKALIKDFN